MKLLAILLYDEDGINWIGDKVFLYENGGVWIFYPDGVRRFISKTWEGEMFV